MRRLPVLQTRILPPERQQEQKSAAMRPSKPSCSAVKSFNQLNEPVNPLTKSSSNRITFLLYDVKKFGLFVNLDACRREAHGAGAETGGSGAVVERIKAAVLDAQVVQEQNQVIFEGCTQDTAGKISS